jgi:cell division transport system permease protein
VQLADPAEADIEQARSATSQAVTGASPRHPRRVAAAAQHHGRHHRRCRACSSWRLIVAATVLAIIFATRGTMSSNREIVDVLHFIGASNSFIAGEFQGRFLTIGFRGGIIGGIGALVFFFLIGLTAGAVVSQEAGQQLGILFGRFALGWDGMLGILAVVPVIAAVTAITSRLTVRRFLQTTS